MTRVHALYRMLILLLTAVIVIAGCSNTDGDASETQQAIPSNSATKEITTVMRAIPKLPEAAETIDVVQRSEVDTPYGDFAARSLQGLVNKKQPRIYIQDSWHREGVDVEQLRQNLLKIYGERTLHALALDESYDQDRTFWTLFDKYGSEVKSLYVFDEKLPDTVNVAAMLAGRNSGIAVPAHLAEQLAPLGLPVTDVTKEYGFTDHIQINRWIADNMVKGSNKQIVFVLNPTGRDNFSEMLPQAYDLAIATDSLIYHVNPFLQVEVELQKSLLDQFPDHTLVVGWAGMDIEGDYIKSVSLAGKSVICTDWGYPNGSIWAAFPSFYSNSVQPVIPDNYPVSNNRTYVAFTISDGDAWHYASRDLLSFWNQPSRGSVPIGWTVPALFSEGNPLIMRYLYNTKSANDEFMQGPSGYGYVYAGSMPEEAYDSYLTYTKLYLDAMGLNMVNYWDLNAGNNALVGADESLIAKYVQRVGSQAVFRGHDGDGSYKMMDGAVVTQEVGNTLGAGTRSAEDIVKAVDRAKEKTPAGQPTFVMVNVEAWGDGVSSIQAAIDALNDRNTGEYAFVKPSELTAAVRAYTAGKSEAAQPAKVGPQPAPYEVAFAADGGQEELRYMQTDRSSGLFNEEHRFADNGDYWIYKIPLPEAYQAPRLQLLLSGQYKIDVSTDGLLWTTVKSSTGVEAKLDVYVDLKKQLARHQGDLFVKISDAVPSDGFGPSLYEFKFIGRAG